MSRAIIMNEEFVNHMGMAMEKDHVYMYDSPERKNLVPVHKNDVVANLFQGWSFALYFPIFDTIRERSLA